MAYTYDELHSMTVVQLREIAEGIEHDAVHGFSTMHKEHLLPAVCKALGVDIHKHPHHEATGIDKTKIKDQMKALKAEKRKAREAGDHAQLKAVRRKYHRLNHRIRGATVA